MLVGVIILTWGHEEWVGMGKGAIFCYDLMVVGYLDLHVSVDQCPSLPKFDSITWQDRLNNSMHCIYMSGKSYRLFCSFQHLDSILHVGFFHSINFSCRNSWKGEPNLEGIIPWHEILWSTTSLLNSMAYDYDIYSTVRDIPW